MEKIMKQIEIAKQEIDNFIITDGDISEQFRIQFLGTKGSIKTLMSIMKDVPTESKKEIGQLLNDVKIYAEKKWETLKLTHLPRLKNLSKENNNCTEDYSLPATSNLLGSRHPISIVRNQIISIFNHLGFSIAEGPEVEDDWHNFTALNLPASHPARDMQDTFYVSQNPDWLLRTHTSSVQVREMQKGILPLRIICPGRVYRNETISARAHCFFHQIEGLYIDENVSFADLKQTLYFFVKEFFGQSNQEVKVRFRPSYFPFTEPSAEMDISCLLCKGKGCSVCKHSGWVEILGCGMVHPTVLDNCNIDNPKYTGFAFGMGIERITMLKYQIKDLRLFSENDTRFLSQFAGAV